jgi:uncharacterized protein (DUF1330 family)
MARVNIAAAALVGALGGAGGLHLVHARGPAPAFLVAETEITDPATFREYAEKFPATIVPYGGKIIAYGGRTDAKEGAPPAGRVTIIQYPSLKAAQDAWSDPAFQALTPLRQKSSRARFLIVEGLAQ